MTTPMRGRAGNSRPRAGSEPRVDTEDGFLSLLGRRVRAAREERGLSRKQLAESADVSERYLAQLELGDGNASVTLLRRVSRALGVRLTELLGDEERREQQLITKFLDSLPIQRLEEVLQHLVREFGAEEAVRRKRIALIGLRGAGKSTLGSALAKQMRRPFIELDREIERELGMQLSEIFLLYGQPGYRKAERRCLDRIIGSQSEVIVSIGGGVVSEPETFHTLLANCYTVWIKASPAEHMSRVIAQGDMRPMKGHAQAMQDLKNILSSREAEYARADAVVDTSGKSVEKSLAALRRAAS
jgi:XRE family transcriptional regulator, aerobic/anaerobic benzoate catabolism transcriptional regulator